MAFYQDFASAYNQIFPMNEEKYQFLNKHLPNGLILDIACATGQYTTRLASDNRQIIGMDKAREMIEQAPDHPNVRYLVNDMQSIHDRSRYDGIYSVGNTLVHITTLDEIKAHLNDLYHALKPGGTLILQLINYDRVIMDNVEELPTIKRGSSSLKRGYSHSKNTILFQTSLDVNGMTYDNETPLYPLQSDQLLTMLEEIGYTNIKTYGSFEETSYNRDTSYHLIVTTQTPVD